MKITLSVKAKQIAVFVSFSIIMSALLMSISFYESVEALRAEVEQGLLSEARRLSDGYDHWVMEQFVELAGISRYVDIDYSPEMHEILAEASQRLGYNSIAPADLKGILHLSDGMIVDLSHREYLQTLFKEKKPVISDPVYSTVPGQEDLYTVLFAVPIWKNGQLAGAMIAQKKAEFLLEYLNSVNHGEGSSNFIISKAPYPIAHTDQKVTEDKFDAIALSKEDPSLLALAGIIQNMMDGKEGVGQYKSQGSSKYIAYSPAKNMGWNIGINMPVKTAMSALNDLKIQMTLIGFFGILFGTVVALLVGKAFADPIRIVSDNINAIASGEADLTKRISFKKRKDEIGTLVIGFNLFIENLHGIVSTLKTSQDSLNNIGLDLATSSQESASAISQILANIEGVRRQSVKQNKSTDTVSVAIGGIETGISQLETLIETQGLSSAQASSAIEEMINNINMVTQSVEIMADRFSQLMASAEQGKTRQEAVEQSIQEISSQSALLVEANEVIAGIASQTNLLAMNAAIEAAHAGDAGKGFSVVSDEIRKLSETSSSQSQTIGSQLASIEQTIQNVVVASKESGTSYTSIIQEIEKTDHLVKEVSLAMSEQKEGSKQVLEALKHMNESGGDVKEQAEKMIQETGTASHSMKDLAEISSLVQNSMDEMGAGAAEINESAQTVSRLAENTRNDIEGMEKAIGKFKI